jgi:NDP-sugar pyrophosphorylase family protein
MQAIIFAAGLGKRMGEFTKSVPKPMLVVRGKTLLEHKLEILPESVNEIILIVGYLSHVIRSHFGDRRQGKRIRYVEQERFNAGTADALWKARPLVTEKFIAMNGDDLYSPHDLGRCLSLSCAMLVRQVEALYSGGRVFVNENNFVTEVVEGDHGGVPGLVNAGMYVLPPTIFSNRLIAIPGRTEFGLPQTLLKGGADVPISAVLATNWISITSPEDLARAERVLGL